MANPVKFKGALSDPSIPHGSPLDPTRDIGSVPPLGVLSQQPATPFAQTSPQPALSIQDAGTPIGALSSNAPIAPITPHLRSSTYKPFSKENRSDTLLAIGTGLLSHPESFAAGVGAAGKNVGALREKYDAEGKPKRALGGPDNAFEVATDPVSGEQTYKEIPAFIGYLDRKNAAKKAPSAKDNVAIMASLAQSVMNQPPEKQQAAYDAQRGVLSKLGFDLSGLPEAYGSSMGTLVRDMGVSAPAAMANQARAARAAQAQNNADRNYDLRKQSTDLARIRTLRGPAPKAAPSSKLPNGFILEN